MQVCKLYSPTLSILLTAAACHHVALLGVHTVQSIMTTRLKAVMQG